MFNKARDAFDEAVAGPDPSEKLMSDMKETGLAMTKSAISTLEQMSIPMQVYLKYHSFLFVLGAIKLNNLTLGAIKQIRRGTHC